jgi:fatty acid desaturase
VSFVGSVISIGVIDEASSGERREGIGAKRSVAGNTWSNALGFVLLLLLGLLFASRLLPLVLLVLLRLPFRGCLIAVPGAVARG